MVSCSYIYNPISYLKIFLSIVLTEKIECSKVGTKGILRLVPDIRAKLKLRLVYAEVQPHQKLNQKLLLHQRQCKKGSHLQHDEHHQQQLLI